MANALYPAGIDGLMTGLIDLDTAVIKAMLVRGYTYDATDVTVADVTGSGGTINGTSAALTNKSISGGVFDADDTTISTTASASDHVLILFQSSAVTGGADVAASSQRLIAFFDTGSGLPIQPGTANTPVTWSSGADRIFRIG